MARRSLLLGPALLSALVLSACYGSTEPATDVGEDTATVHARGTANRGPATSYFEYWTAGDPATGYPTPRTPSRSWPAGASGRVSEKLSDLLVASRYSFRFCGADQGTAPVCAQTRTFTTRSPAGDYVTGSIGLDASPRVQPFALRFNARSGAAGENPQGTVTTVEKNGSRSVNSVFCFRATGSRARVAIAIVGSDSWVLLDVQTGRESVGIATVNTPPNCSSTDSLTSHTGEGSPTVHDAP